VQKWAGEIVIATHRAQASNARAGDDLAAKDAELQKLKNDGYVKAALAVKRFIFWLKVIAGVWIVAAIVGRGLTLFGPAGWANIGMSILKVTHMVNPAVWGLSLQQKWQRSRALDQLATEAQSRGEYGKANAEETK
jgi:hypothetical protein